MYTALDISNFFISKGGVSPLKLQKLLYYSQVWYFVKKKNSLFSDNIGAWVYGPAIYNVWSNFRFMKRSSDIPKFRAKEINFPNNTLSHLEDVWNAYGHLTGAQLVDLTHSEKPWTISRQGYLDDQPSDKFITIDDYTTSDYQLTQNNTIPKAIMPLNALGSFDNRI
ncbi:DUF4065 domain-containing protein [Myroides odoratimimus]|uniref:Panacea domain-containing protein n=1 Tax=Myroides odoratimimus TaxID=76832 RepID=UPI0020969131|nr:type II toxin-antitoxin system antitoxin SocA domain-containing protein [Myroides odoratimimus]MCO7721944.1 DUF4065 domain-containing protein [Myroides odoratimimus]